MAKKAIAKKAPTKKVVARKVAVKKAVHGSAETEIKTSSALPETFNIDEITRLLSAVNESGVNELKLEKGAFKITIRQGFTSETTLVQSQPSQHIAPAPAQATSVPSTAPPAPTPAAAPTEDNLITIKSPMIGTFYRSSGPDKPPFVNVGDSVKEGQPLCIVEAMKLFNEIECEVSGTIVKVLVDDASPIEYDQPLFLVQP